jgi:predicted amidophosphoribosyltransferase
MLAEVLEGLARVIVPPVCPLCQGDEPIAGAASLCVRCRERLPVLEEPFCPLCGVPFRGADPSHPCAHCLTDPPEFERLVLRRALEGLFLEAFDRFYGQTLPRISAVVPVPCHPATLHRRGFDLPALLSRRLSKDRSIPWRPTALAKRESIPELVRLTAAERSRAVSRAYVPREPLGGTVLLVDDVVTTTATARACATACIQAGANRVCALALARTPLEAR